MLPSPRCVSIRPLSCLLLTRGTLGALGTSIRVLLRSQNRESKRQFASQHHRHRCRSIDPNNSSNSTSIPNATTMSVKRDPCPLVLSTWRSARAVCFDVDSTLCTDESIDEIAAFLGVGEQVAALTSQAMGGSTKFEDALAARLGLMKPSRSQIAEFIEKNPPKLSPGIPELVKELQAKGTKVFLVSGGFRAVIEPIADLLNIPRSHVFANSILFDPETGAYAGFDAKEHTSRSGGKLAAVQAIRKQHQGDLKPFPIVAVGDGATDAEAVSADGSGADVFVGYGGVVERVAVAERADWFVKSIQELRDALKGGGGEGENGVAA